MTSRGDHCIFSTRSAALKAVGTLRAVALLCCTSPWLGFGQETRFELGQRLRAFEIAWENQMDAQARARSVPHLVSAVRQFFSLSPAQAAQSLDQARFAVLSAAPPPESVIWATSLFVKPATRLVDQSSGTLDFRVAPFYRKELEAPRVNTIQISLIDAKGQSACDVAGSIDRLPWSGRLAWQAIAEGDYRLVAKILLHERHVDLCPQTISIVAKPEQRVKRLESSLKQLENTPNTTQKASLAAQVTILRSLLDGETLETNYPAARMLAEAEAASEALLAGKEYFGQGRSGEFWLSLACGRARLPVRFMAPDSVATRKPLPLLIALHGAGGSENMFFDAYGHGKVVTFCRQRGWLLVAPRLSFLGLGVSLDQMLMEIDRLYPVDKRQVFVIGHSMGAMQAVALAQQAREPLAAVAAISGGGRLGKTGPWTKTAFFVLAGDQDFGLPGARRLADALRSAGAEEVRFDEVKNAEHLGVVQASLGDIFAFFDKIAGELSTSTSPARTARN